MTALSSRGSTSEERVQLRALSVSEALKRHLVADNVRLHERHVTNRGHLHISRKHTRRRIARTLDVKEYPEVLRVLRQALNAASPQSA